MAAQKKILDQEPESTITLVLEPQTIPEEDEKTAQERELLRLREEIAERRKELLGLQDAELKSLKAKEEEAATESKDPWKKQRENDERLCRVRFEFREQPGGTLEFSFKKYPGESLKVYRGKTGLKDGQTYSLPLGVVKHLMTSGRCPEYKHERSIDESQTDVVIGSWRTRYSVSPLDFIADEELQSIQDPQIVTASFQR